MDAENAKAYYRRAMAYVEMESSASLELAVRDLTASAFAPRDAVVRARCKNTRRSSRRRT